MEQTISEQTYPVHSLWIIKPILAHLVILGVLLVWALSLSDPRAYLYLFYFVLIIIIQVIVRSLQRDRYHYLLEPQYLTLQQGILKKQQRHIPYGVIQTVFVKQDLLDRVFGLSSLTVENASQGAGQPQKVFGLSVPANKQKQRQAEDALGFSGNAVRIQGLKRADAESLKNAILQMMEQHPANDAQSGL